MNAYAGSLWEYKNLPTFDEDVMNELGAQGWECVSAVYMPAGHRAVITMKRPKTPKGERFKWYQWEGESQ